MWVNPLKSLRSSGFTKDLKCDLLLILIVQYSRLWRKTPVRFWVLQGIKQFKNHWLPRSRFRLDGSAGCPRISQRRIFPWLRYRRQNVLPNACGHSLCARTHISGDLWNRPFSGTLSRFRSCPCWCRRLSPAFCMRRGFLSPNPLSLSLFAANSEP